MKTELSIAQFNIARLNLTKVLCVTLANIIQKMMPLYGFCNLTDVCVCVYTSETEHKIISLPIPSPPDDIFWTKNSPGNLSQIFFSGIFVL